MKRWADIYQCNSQQPRGILTSNYSCCDFFFFFYIGVSRGEIQTIDWPILIFFITDTDYLYVYVPDNQYAEPIFIYCYKVNK